MNGRRAAALLGVLAMHVALLLGLRLDLERTGADIEFASEPITIDLNREPVTSQSAATSGAPAAAALPAPQLAPPAPAEAAVDVTPSTAISSHDQVDWPVEAKKSAARVLAAEAEAERIARMFSGPKGTWASLTKRERSRVRKFRWKPGVDGLEYDERGNAIYHISEGCVLVNFAFIGCTLGKAKVHGDLFKDMRLYFDEQRLPPIDDGNGTEPEALRPAN